MSERLETLKEYLKADPKDAFLLFAVAKEYEKQGNDAVAYEYYLQIRTHDPGYIGLYYHLGKLHERRGENELAKAVYNQGIELAKEINDFHSAGELSGALESM